MRAGKHIEVRPDGVLGPANPAQDRVRGGSTTLSGGVGFAIAIDGVLVPQDPAEAFLAGVADDVPLLTGTTTDEYRLWFVPDAPSTASTAWTC
jgi:carboxylesterase type B